MLDFRCLHLFPDSCVRVPKELLAWRRKYKQIGKNVFVKVVPTLEELTKKYGAHAQLKEDKVTASLKQVKDPQELAEWAKGKTLWEQSCNRVARDTAKYRIAEKQRRLKHDQAKVHSLNLDIEMLQLDLAKMQKAFDAKFKSVKTGQTETKSAD